jgi:hypothetical protein
MLNLTLKKAMAEKNKGKSLFNGRAQSAANSKENEGSQERSEED